MKNSSRVTPPFIPALALFAFVAAPGMLLAQGGVPLGSEFRVNTYVTGPQNRASVASDSAGNFVVAWHSLNHEAYGNLYGIFGQRYAGSGTPLGGEFRINTYTTNNQQFPSVSSDSAGNFVVVWGSNRDGSGYGVFAQRYASTGTPLGVEFRVNSYTSQDQAFPSVASNSSGNFVVAWQSRSQDGSFDGVFAQRYASTGAPLGGEFRVNSYTSYFQIFPRVSSDSAGNFVVAWASNRQDGSGYGVFAQRYASTGTPLGGEFRVNSYTAGDQSFPSVASDSAGNFIVAWQSESQDGIQAGVFAQRYASTGTPLGGEFRVNSYTTQEQRSPSVASDPAGNFVVAWRDFVQDGSVEGVFAQRYASTGAPIGGEFRVNTYTFARQEFPAVAADSAGNFVVAWSSDTQDGSYEGIFAQRYDGDLIFEDGFDSGALGP